MPLEWSAYDMKRDGQAEWLVRLGEKAIAGMRAYGGLPSVSGDGYMVLDVPTLVDQAHAMNVKYDAVPGSLIPSGVVKFID